MSRTATTKLTFKHKRNLYPPSAGKGVFIGEDVLAIKRVVARYGFWPWQEFDEVFSEAFSKGRKNDNGKIIKGWEGLIGAQRKMKIAPVTGWYGEATHADLLDERVPITGVHAGDRVWDQASINLYQGFEDFTAAEKIVTDIYSWWDWAVKNTGPWHYSQDRPIQALVAHEEPPQLPTWSDCSGTAIYMAWLADAISPDRWYGFTGYGNTGSLSTGGFEISRDTMDKWARDHYVLAFFGPSRYNTKHVVAIKNSKRVYSHGHESAPEIYSYLTQGRKDLLEIRAYPVV